MPIASCGGRVPFAMRSTLTGRDDTGSLPVTVIDGGDEVFADYYGGKKVPQGSAY